MPGNKTKNGFSLIEISISIFILLAILTALVSISQTYNFVRRGDLQNTAGKIASKQLETLRKMDSLPSCPSPSGCTFTQSDISQLPSGTGTQFIDPYSGSQDIKLITTKVSWIANGVTSAVLFSTLIYKNGL